MKETAIVLNGEFAVAILQYLQTKPFIEVELFIDGIRKSPQVDVKKIEELLKEE